MQNSIILILSTIILLVLLSTFFASEILYFADQGPSKLSETSGYSDNENVVSQTHSTNFKVLSFNIAGDSKNWEERKSACYYLIKTQNPDIIGFQELLPVNLQWMIDNFPKMGWYGLTIEGRTEDYPDDVEGESCRILYNLDRFSVDSTNSGAFWFSLTPDLSSEGWDDMRYCVFVRLLDISTGEGIYIYNTHWSFSSQYSRINAARIMIDRIPNRTYTKEPFLVTGDFNAWSSDTDMQILLNNMSIILENRIDWILGQPNKFEIVNSGFISDINGLPASDHNVLSVNLLINN